MPMHLRSGINLKLNVEGRAFTVGAGDSSMLH